MTAAPLFVRNTYFYNTSSTFFVCFLRSIMILFSLLCAYQINISFCCFGYGLLCFLLIFILTVIKLIRSVICESASRQINLNNQNGSQLASSFFENKQTQINHYGHQIFQESNGIACVVLCEHIPQWGRRQPL